MQYIPDSSLNIIEVELNLQNIYPDNSFTINVPQDINYIVLDSSHTLIGFVFEPIKHVRFYHPHPGTDFNILGQFYDNYCQTLSLLKTSHLLSSIHS